MTVDLTSEISTKMSDTYSVQRFNTPKVASLVRMATVGLTPMFDSNARLFCYRLKQTENGLVQQGLSQRYTVITLMGLHRLEQAGIKSPIPIGPTIDGLLANLDWVDNIGDLGLLLWMCGLVAPGRVSEILKKVDLTAAWNRYADVRQGITMHVAWFLTGISQVKLACPELLPDVEEVANQSYKLLRKNQGHLACFAHSTTNVSLTERARAWIGSFADQVYPVYAMTKFSKAYGRPDALEPALECAHRLCELQGRKGQWWWHYDSRTGSVLDPYPVFSVHQHGMAPMTLFEIGEATGTSFENAISNGLRWITDNELSRDMRDLPSGIIWRCLFRPRIGRYSDTFRNLLSRNNTDQMRTNVRVLLECRPYELGWLLYAFAGRAQ